MRSVKLQLVHMRSTTRFCVCTSCLQENGAYTLKCYDVFTYLYIANMNLFNKDKMYFLQPLPFLYFVLLLFGLTLHLISFHVLPKARFKEWLSIPHLNFNKMSNYVEKHLASYNIVIREFLSPFYFLRSRYFTLLK